MNILKAGFEILTPISEGGIDELKHIEKIGRVCYKSEGNITEDGESAKKFVKMLTELLCWRESLIPPTSAPSSALRRR